MMDNSLPFQVALGILVSILLLGLLIFRELAAASTDTRWKKSSQYLIILIVPLVIVFLVLIFIRIDSFQSMGEFRRVVVGGPNLSLLFGEESTPTPYQPSFPAPTPTITADLSRLLTLVAPEAQSSTPSPSPYPTPSPTELTKTQLSQSTPTPISLGTPTPQSTQTPAWPTATLSWSLWQLLYPPALRHKPNFSSKGFP